MIFSLLGSVILILVGNSSLTTLSFDTEIVSFVYGGKQSDIYFKKAHNNKTLIIKAKKSFDPSNLLVVTRRRKYAFDLKYSKKPDGFLDIKHGVINRSYKLILDKKRFKVFEGNTSLRILGKGITVNNQKINGKAYASKGARLFINKKEVRL